MKQHFAFVVEVTVGLAIVAFIASCLAAFLALVPEFAADKGALAVCGALLFCNLGFHTSNLVMQCTRRRR